jgi:hypothetical protein
MTESEKELFRASSEGKWIYSIAKPELCSLMQNDPLEATLFHEKKKRRRAFSSRDTLCRFLTINM